jgi:hypothetical protein
MMPIEIDGVSYFAAAEVAKEVRVSRQTLWRWRQDGKIPIGRRFRDRQILFSTAELEAVREYANRLEPADVGTNQMKLFNGPRSGGD